MQSDAVDEEPPTRIDPEGNYTMRLRTLFLIISGVAIVSASWWSIKSDVNGHGRQLETINSKLGAIEGAAFDARAAALESKYQQALLKQSVDYLVNDRRGPKPPITSAQ